MEQAVQLKETYDKVFSEGGFEGVYELPYWHSSYYPLFKRVLREVLRRNVTSVLEVGCGTGGFAHFLMTKTTVEYHGFDFSRVAVEKAVARTNRQDAFFEADATARSTYDGRHYDCIACTEVLEHIEQDLEVISNWKTGVFCVCSVPNFDSETHARFFHSAEEVRTRYGQLIDIESIVRIKKPVLSHISIFNVLRALRWNRYRPRKFLTILGMGSFDSLGGWFVFSEPNAAKGETLAFSRLSCIPALTSGLLT